MPIGENFPTGVTGDFRGLKLGESYDAVKPKLEAIRSESGVAEDESSVSEGEMALLLPAANGSSIEARYKQLLKLELTPSSSLTYDTINAYFSAPSSGSQLVGLYRSISYGRTENQPKISDVLAGLADKFGGPLPLGYDFGSSVRYQANFDDGTIWSEETPNQSCQLWMTGSLDMDERMIAEINPTGRCDIVLNVEFRRGISPDHAETIIMTLSDNARGATTLQTDFQYLMDYMNGRVEQGGTAPAL